MFNTSYKTAAWSGRMTSTLLAQFEEIPAGGSVILNLYVQRIPEGA
jgi:hypothetical protein